MAEVVLPVEGMDCSGCELNIEFALATVDGVSEAKADHWAKTVKVAFDPSVTSEAELRRTIDDIGYRVSS